MAGELISRIYGNFRGVDFRGEEINLMRSPDSLNVWKDYKETESIRTRPGLKLYEKPFLKNSTDAIHGIYFYNDSIYVHKGDSLYIATKSDKEFYTDAITRQKLKKQASNGFIYEEQFYFMDGGKYWVWGCDNETHSTYDPHEVVGYIPTTSISKEAQQGGTILQDTNMLTPLRINTFRGDGKGTEFWLDKYDIDTDYSPIVKVNDEVVTNYTVDYANGKITFKTAPTAPNTDGQDNISVQFSKTIEGYREMITNCTMLQVFDNRVFVSGNPKYPNMVWHCSLNDPTYFSDTDFYREGMDLATVTGMVAGNNALWVFREPSETNTTVFYHTPTIDEEYGKVYPSTHSSVTTGCIGKAINFNDDIVFFSERGMEGISGDITTEQVLGHRSTLVDRKLTAEPNYKNMILEEWEGYLMVFIGNKVYLADSRTAFTNEDHIEYEWFYWELEHNITCAKVNNGILYLGTENGELYTLTDNESDVESYWTTPKDKFQYPQKQKTSNKRGCVVEASGDISIYAKLEDTDFELIGEYKNITDYFVSRIKRKKFKDIQLKFYSKTRFSLETATLECFVGGYLKR